MLSYPFMQYAFIASFFISIICAIIGVFVVARKTSFYVHTLSEISFSGASFAIFAGISPIGGMLMFTILSSIFVSLAGRKLSQREASVSVFSAVFIGLGVLFLSLSNKQSSYATNILFGSIVGISKENLYELLLLIAFILLITVFMFRRLKYISFDTIGAEFNAKGTLWIGLLFLILVACTVSVTAQIVGSLLIFSLLTVPASSAKYLATSVHQMMLISFIFSLFGTWMGLYLSYISNWPVSFFITIIEGVFYCFSLLYHKLSTTYRA
ncbi:ABC transporter permease [Leuconostoc litchii]|uniref:Metal ABC transporter permease n=1 Tax=Leuconostoc litchii TaxID=1981069 RepID=A0A6P2CM91_9LACO|nr:metal ABC transporter permease [Leuconostoc litchii]TYC47138.1 metal ABC transporter permease [Leuconostoc litchii]GMA69097.1 ABC transporter permease [Leuconostoc litchii]